jgi:hypothetical protein
MSVDRSKTRSGYEESRVQDEGGASTAKYKSSPIAAASFILQLAGGSDIMDLLLGVNLNHTHPPPTLP